MSKALSYSDAVRLLGGQDSKIMSVLDKVAGGVLLGTAAGIPGLLALFDAKAEAVRLGHDLLRKLSERRGRLSRYSRSQRLEAAHVVLVVTAYFESLKQTELPFRFVDLKLTKAEQVSMAGGHSLLDAETADLVAALWSVGIDSEPQLPHENHVTRLLDYYLLVSNSVTSFIRGLAVWDRLTEADRTRFHQAMEDVPQRACDRYEDLFRRLVADFPEVACWANFRDHQATRTEVRDLGIALAGLERMLTEISTGSVPDERRAGLTRAYRVALERPIAEFGDVPAGLQIPTLV